MEWIFELIKFLVAFSVGVLTAIWAYEEDYNKAVDDAYTIGYLKGQEEAQNERG